MLFGVCCLVCCLLLLLLFNWPCGALFPVVVCCALCVVRGAPLVVACCLLIVG